MNDRKRETLGSRLGFIMLAAGCAIGLGNVWRFPFVTGKYGGAYFVLLYLGFLVLLGFPIMIMELSIGRAARTGMYGALRDLPAKHPSRWRIPGGIVFSGNLILMMMYTTVTGWMLAYFFGFLSGDLASAAIANREVDYFAGFLASPLRMSCCMAIVVAAGSLICGVGLRNGVERITKVMMVWLLFLLAGLAVYSATLPGAAAGLSFYLFPDWSRFAANGMLGTVSAAMSQAFFTLSLGIGSIAIFGSYIGRERSLPQESCLIIATDTAVALLAGVLVFSACFSYDIEVASGPGLILISMTSVFNHMPYGQLVGTFFFLFMFIAAFTTVVAVFENLIAFMIDEWHWARPKAALVNFVAVGLLSLPCVLGYNLWSNIHPLGGNSTVLDFEDWLVSSNLLPLGALLLVLFCTLHGGWGWRNFLKEANTGRGVKLPGWFKWYAFTLLPLAIAALFALDIYNRFIR
ncbi:MAG: sodium-dependent transporter [Victivallaceae bacterium]|nr:sodium-dependent transporter [Victivallaceae bacterium]